MNNPNTFPDYYILLRKIDKKTLSVVFHRNNFSKQLFKQTDNGYIYHENVEYHDCKIKINILIKSADFDCIFRIVNDSIIPNGNSRGFGITFISKHYKMEDVSNRALNIKINNHHNDVKIECDLIGYFYKYKLYNLNGNVINKPYFPPKHKKNKKDKMAPYESVYKVSSWSVRHPYGGGSFTPK